MQNTLNGAEAMVRMLEAHGVRHMFGLCGDTTLPFYDALHRLTHGINHVLTRDERSAAYMADGYARVTGRVVDEITGNVSVQNPAETNLEIARRELGLPRMGVAAITSWGHFPYIVESRPGTIFVNAGYQDVPAAVANPST